MPFIDLGDKKSQIRLLVAEFVIIFVSVVLAFFFEDYRESKNDEEQYEEALLIFGSEFKDEIQSTGSKIDSFKVDNLSWNGEWFATMKEHVWLDSMIDIKEANMAHFSYFFAQGYFTNYSILKFHRSPLSEELRVQHGEHANQRNLRRVLSRYDEAYNNLEGIDETYVDYYQDLEGLLNRTDPTGKYTSQDSLIFYSNEFRNIFKRLANLRKVEIQYLKYLIHERWVPVANTLIEEVMALGAPLPDDSYCYQIKNWQERFECWEEKSPKNPVPIEEFLQKRRSAFLQQYENR